MINCKFASFKPLLVAIELRFKIGKKDKIRMPAREAGIVRYFEEEYKSKIMLKPEYVVVLCVLIAIGAVVIRLM